MQGKHLYTKKLECFKSFLKLLKIFFKKENFVLKFSAMILNIDLEVIKLTIGKINAHSQADLTLPRGY